MGKTNTAEGGRKIFSEMQIKIFTIPLLDGEEGADEMNRFLASHRVVDVQQEFVADKYWTFCVKYLQFPSGESSPAATHRSQSSVKKDYKQELSETEFAVFTKLREARKKIANSDALPAYTVFTDAELAVLSKQEKLTLPGMKNLYGVGKARVEHYGERIIELYEQLVADETLQPPAGENK